MWITFLFKIKGLTEVSTLLHSAVDNFSMVGGMGYTRSYPHVDNFVDNFLKKGLFWPPRSKQFLSVDNYVDNYVDNF